MAKEKGMGKGLSALLGEDFSADFSTPSSTLPIAQIENFQNQPRRNFDPEKLQELADSIQQHGIIQPLTVRKLSSGYYQIIAGERRWRAARLAGLSEVPAVVIEADDQKAMELAMIENLQREDLNPIEEAEGFRVLTSTYGMSQAEAAERVGRSRSAVANAMRLLDLEPFILQMVENGDITAGHARALLPLNPAMREQAVNEIVKYKLNVRQTEHLARKLQAMSSAEEKNPQPAEKSPDYAAEAARSLSTKLGRNCRISQGKKKGKIEIEYYSVDDLNDLLEALERLGG